MSNLTKKSSFGALRPINEQLGSSQSRNIKNNLSDIASYIDKKDNSFDSGYDFADELKKYGFETQHIGDEEQSYQTKNQASSPTIPTYNVMNKLGKSTGIEDNFLDFSNLLKMRQDQPKSMRSEQQYFNKGKLQVLRKQIVQFNKKNRLTKQQIQIRLLQYQEFQMEEIDSVHKKMKLLVKKIEESAKLKIQDEKAKFDNQCKRFQMVNKEMRQNLSQANFTIKELQMKIRTKDRYIEELELDKDEYKKQIQSLKTKEKDIKKQSHQFQIPKTDIDYSFCKIQIQHLKLALSDLQRQNSSLKMVLQTKNSENAHSNQTSQIQNTEIDKSRYLNVIQKFQEEIQILQNQIQQLRIQEKQKSDRIMKWQRDFQEQQQQLERAIDECEKKERFLKDFQRKLKLREQALSMRQQIIQNAELSYQKANNSPQKLYQYQPRTPRIRGHISPSSINMGYYSPKMKQNQWGGETTERISYHNTSRNFLYGGQKKYFQKDRRINNRIQKIQNSLNRQLSNLSRRY